MVSPNKMVQRFSIAAILFIFAIVSFPRQACATASWSRKYQVDCRTCHAPLFARLNYEGEKFLWNGYQLPTSPADGDEVGKTPLGDRLFLDKQIGHWLMARLNLTPFQIIGNSSVVDGERIARLTIGNANWLQMFVAGSIAKNLSIYIETEFEQTQAIFNWYYLTFSNILSSLVNLQAGFLSPVVFAPYSDRLPQLPAIGGGVMRIESSNGDGDLSVDLRSPRPGLQYYGYGGPFMIYGGVTPGSRPIVAAKWDNLGYWAGLRLLMPEGMMPSLVGSSVGFQYLAGTDVELPPSTNLIENEFWRIMPSLNLRFRDKLDVQGAYVFAHDDNWTLDSLADIENEFGGVRLVASYYLGDAFAVSTHYDYYSADNDALLATENRLYLPVLTYLPRQNVRFSLYPGYDLRDVDGDLKRHEILLNIRVGF